MKDLFFKGVKINKKPMTQEEANYLSGILIMNYGYKPEIVESQDI